MSTKNFQRPGEVVSETIGGKLTRGWAACTGGRTLLAEAAGAG